MKDMKLGLQLGYWGSGPPADAAEQVAEAERLGFDSIWTAEAYGSDALTPLSWWGSQTRRVRLGTALCQLSARTPTAMGMAAITLDHLSGGRFVLGLGVSGPQVVEGWYGQSFEKPLARTARVRRHRAPGHRPRGAGHQRRSPLPTPLPGRHRTGQAAQAHRASPAQGDPDHPGGRGTEERRPGRRDRRRMVPHLLLPQRGQGLRAGAGRGIRPAGGPTQRRRLRGHRLRPDAHRRRHRAGGRQLSADASPSTSAAWGPSR